MLEKWDRWEAPATKTKTTTSRPFKETPTAFALFSLLIPNGAIFICLQSIKRWMNTRRKAKNQSEEKRKTEKKAFSRLEWLLRCILIIKQIMAEATHGKFKYKEKKANFQCLVWQQSREAMIFYKHSLRRSCAKCLIIMRREFEISSSSSSHPVSIFSGNWKNSRHSAFNLIWKSCDDSSRGIQSRSLLYRAARKRSGLRRGFRERDTIAARWRYRANEESEYFIGGD